MQHLNLAELEKLIHRSGQNLTVPSRIDKKHQTPNRTINSQIKPATTMQK